MSLFRRKTAAAAVGVMATLAVASAFAGQQTGQVTQVIVRASDGLVHFYMNGTATAKPACAANPYWVIKDENSAIGKRQLAMLLMARESGKQVIVGGANTCTRWADGEDVEYIRY